MAGLLPHIGPSVFDGLSVLEHLDLSNNDLLFASTHAFRGLHSLRELNLAGNLLREVLPCSELTGQTGTVLEGKICFDHLNPGLERLSLQNPYP